MDISFLFSFLSGMCILATYAIYNRDIFLGRTKPSAVSWGIWAVITTLNMASYFVMTGDILKNSLPMVASVACLITFLFLLGKKNYAPPAMIDYSTLSIGVLAILGWWQFRSALFANMLLQFANVIAFIPTYRSVWNNPKNEKPLPWALFVLSYIFLTATVILRFKGNIADLVFPILAIFLHSAVVFLIFFRKIFLPAKDIA